jgi:opacity protein-like surface antigen
MTTPATRGWRALLAAALAIVLLSSAGTAQTAKPKPNAWSQARLVGTWYRDIKQSEYDALGIGDQNFPVGHYKIVVDKIGFFDAYAHTAPKKIDFNAKLTARTRNRLWIGPPPGCGQTGNYHGRIANGKLTITNDDADTECPVRRAIFAGTWTR